MATASLAITKKMIVTRKKAKRESANNITEEVTHKETFIKKHQAENTTVRNLLWTMVPHNIWSQ